MSDIKNILNTSDKKAIKAITDGVAAKALDIEALRLLHEEESKGQKRQSVLACLAKVMDEIANQPPAKDDPKDGADNSDSNSEKAKSKKTDATKPKADKASRGETPEWQKADYSGPMTCEIAAWRNKNIVTK